jgi:hypothetical protein
MSIKYDRSPAVHETQRSAEPPAAKSSFWKHVRQRLAPLDHKDLLATARRRTGLSDFGDPPCEEALRIIVSACNTDANLNMFGQFAAREHFLELLETRLRLVGRWQQMPQTQDESIRGPVFITGLPRSGSTFLHDLFSRDPANRVPLTWEVMFPLPFPKRAKDDPQLRIRKAEHRLRLMRLTNPSIVKAHPIGASLPQECIAILSYSLLSEEFLCMFWVPSYEKWMRTQDMRPAYRFHRNFIAHLPCPSPAERWVFKAPDHVYSLDALLEIYPDARIVFLHRDPMKVLGSVASLAMKLRSAFSNQIDPFRTGINEARVLNEVTLKMMEFRDRHPSPSDRFIDIQYLDLVRNPVATVRQIYERFSLTLSADAERRMYSFLEGRRNKRRPKHVYSLADFGIETDRKESCLAAYCERFGVELEPVI